MKKQNFILLCFSVFLFLGHTKIVQAQNSSQSETDKSTLTKKEKRKQIPKYFGISVGFNSSKFRDFATSPLFYNGTALQVRLSHLKVNDRKEAEFGLLYDFGSYTTDFNEIKTVSKVKRAEINYARLFKVNLLKPESFNTKIGFLLSGTGNLRTNADLQNNGVGMDVFANLMGSIKITKDISRKVATEKKFLFFKYTRKAKKQNLAFRLNLGLINSSFRNGYVYSGQSTVVNDTKPFDGYKFKVFSGFRSSSSLDYTRFLENKNAIQLSYVWDAYSTGGELDKFEMAHHTLRLTLLFNTNNR